MKKDGKVVVDLSKHEGKTRFQGEPALKCKSCGFEVVSSFKARACLTKANAS